MSVRMFNSSMMISSFCDFEFGKEYGSIFSEEYDKIDGKAINDKVGYMNS